MSVIEAAFSGREGLETMMRELGGGAKAAATRLATASAEAKDRALTAAAAAIRRDRDEILAANARDIEAAKAAGVALPLLDRAALDPARLEAIARSLEDIAALPDPVGTVTEAWERPNGLKLERVRTPLGVVGVIYESRPNVTADAGGLCLKAGNAVILRGGSEAFNTNRLLHRALTEGLRDAGLPDASIQLVPTTDRAAVGLMLQSPEFIDVIVPRGGKSLIERVQAEARMPVFAHLEGRCTVYVHKAAEPRMAELIVVNAKMRRTSICGAAETVLVDRAVAESHMKPILDGLFRAGCAVHGDAATAALDARVKPAAAADWDTEWLAPVISAKLVDGLDAAIEHIRRHGSAHTDSIVTDDDEAAARFLAEVDSAIVMHNASTQFADGGEFGMGAEIGIATGRMHARGPVGVEQLCSFKYVVRGAGQTRP